MTKEIEDLNEKIKEKEVNEQKKQALIDEMKEKESQMETKITELQNKYDNYMKNHEKDINNLKFNIKDNEQVISQLTNELDEKNKKINEINLKIENLESNHSEDLKKITELKEQIQVEKDTQKCQIETINELQEKINTLQSENQKFESNTSEFEAYKAKNKEKVQKMKSLLTAANKSLIEIRQQNIDKNEEIIKQKELIATLTENKDKLEKSTKDIKDNFDNIVNTSQSERDALNLKINQLTIDLNNAKKENNDLQTEYQKYKNRANILFQQYSENNIKMKINELEAINSKLEEEKRNEKSKFDEISKRNSSIKDELNNAYEKISTLQNQIFDYEKDMQESNQVKAEITILKTKLKEKEDKHAKELQNIKNNNEIEIQDMKKKYDDEIEKLHLINEQKDKDYYSLKSNNNELNNKLKEKIEEIEKLKKDFKEKIEKQQKQNNLTISTNATILNSKPASSLNTLTAEQSTLTQLISPIPSNRTSNTPVSLSVLLNPNDSTNNINNSSSELPSSLDIPKVNNYSGTLELELKKQVQNLMELLNESEKNVQELTKKEKDLKEELDKMNRDEKRTTVNMEYLKNVVLSFLESNEKDKLVPVITNLLQLDSKEIERLQAISENKRKLLW